MNNRIILIDLIKDNLEILKRRLPQLDEGELKKLYDFILLAKPK